MIWLNPIALVALTAVAAPILIHLLIQRRAERLLFPTLRFLQPTRLAAIRRHLLDDVPLLVIRVALLAAAAAALAGPLLMTSARRQAWDRRVVRARVVDARGDEPRATRPVQGRGRAADGPVLQEKAFDATALADGIRRAVFWLESAPPARREIVVSSAFPMGSITQADIDAIPSAIGLRFERTGVLPVTRTVTAGRLLTSGGSIVRDVTLTADGTAVHDAPSAESATWPIEVVSASADRAAVDAAIAAVRAQHVWAAAPDRRARLVITAASHADVAPSVNSAAGLQHPWTAEAIVKMATDRDLTVAAARVPAGLAGARFLSAPWQILASAADGRPLAVAAGSADGLIVLSSAPATDLATPVLLRSIANAIAPPVDLRSAEVMPIADAVLQRWSRPAAPLGSPRLDTLDQDDRRWLWLLVLVLLLVEMWVRRARAAAEPQVIREEDARVA